MKTKKNFLLIISFSLVIYPLLAQLDVRQSTNKVKSQQTQPQPNVILQQTQQPKPSLPKEEAVLKETKNSSGNKTTQNNGNQETIKLNEKQSSVSILEAMKNPLPKKKKGEFHVLQIEITPQTKNDMDDIYGRISLAATLLKNGKRSIYKDEFLLHNVPGEYPVDISWFNKPENRDFSATVVGFFEVNSEDEEFIQVHIGICLIDRDANPDWGLNGGDDDVFELPLRTNQNGWISYPNKTSLKMAPFTPYYDPSLKKINSGTSELSVLSNGELFYPPKWTGTSFTLRSINVSGTKEVFLSNGSDSIKIKIIYSYSPARN